MKKITTAYASLDIECDGNNPLQHSMRAIGVVLFCGQTYTKIDEFYRNLTPRPGTEPDAKCMQDFWQQHPVQWAHINHNPTDYKTSMNELASWLKFHGKKRNIKWIANPSCFDWMFLKCYFQAFVHPTVFEIGFHCEDLSALIRGYTLAKGITNVKKFKENLAAGLSCTHNALEDARCQGAIYINFRRLIDSEKIRG